LRIVHDENDHIVAEVNGNLQFPDVNAVVELNFTLVGSSFPSPARIPLSSTAMMHWS